MNTAVEERIRTRAYELWEVEGRPEGREIDHWLRAVQELAAQERGGEDAVQAVEAAPRPQRTRSLTARATSRTEAAAAPTPAPRRRRAAKGTGPLS
jgi:Protein of unknown function (DUF2934)